MVKLLISFGDSWVFGVGVNYQENMDKEELMKNAWNDKTCNQYSFRNIVAEQTKRRNLNFSQGGSSNQRQFRLAEEFLLSRSDSWFQENDIIVLWGLTSIYRNEFFDNKKNVYENFCLDSHPFGNWFMKNCFNYEDEIKKLSGKMKLFNSFFKEKKIKNYWFSIFNDHEYFYNIDNVCFNGKSLLDLLVNDFGKNDRYHKSVWKDEDRKIKMAKENKLVNPFSLHPTKESHKILANFFIKEIQD